MRLSKVHLMGAVLVGMLLWLLLQAARPSIWGAHDRAFPVAETDESL